MGDHLSPLLTIDTQQGVKNELPDATLFLVSTELPWFADIVNFLSTMPYPRGASKYEKKKLVMQVCHYSLLGGYLHRFFPREGIYRHCVRDDEMSSILRASHDEPCGGHFAGDLATRKVLTARYWWPTAFKHAFMYCERCGKC